MLQHAHVKAALSAILLVCTSALSIQPSKQFGSTTQRIQLASAVRGRKIGLAQTLNSHDGQDTHNPIEFYQAANFQLGDANPARLTVNDTHIRHTGQWVEVCWHDIRFPAADDYIALVVPANASLSKTAPAKYQWAAIAPTHLESGSGCLTFRLLNMRASAHFVLLRNGFEHPTTGARSDEITVLNPNEPTGGHLALTGKQGEMLVQWTTLDAVHPEVKFGVAPGQHTHTVAADTGSYSRHDMCGGPAAGEGWLDAGSLHRALLTHLKPDTKYYYIYGDRDGGWSEEASFVTPPLVGANSSVSFLAIADMGQAEVDGSNENGFGEQHPSLATTRGLLENADGRRLVIHNGDISYARGYGSQWETFMDQIQPVATRMPWMTVGGNHERDWPGSHDRYGHMKDSGGECGISYEQRFWMPRKSHAEPWYSFDFGPVHFLQYSTEVPFHKGSKQHRFVVEDLKRVDRQKTPWVIVGGHRPIYIDSTNFNALDGDQTVAKDLRDAFEDEFIKHQVDMTWHGHHHSYQRTCPVHKSKCKGFHRNGVAKAPVHVVIGNAGADLCWNTFPNTPSHFEVVEIMWGYMKVDANGTHITCEAMSDSEDGSSRTIDKFTLQKPVGWHVQSAAAAAAAARTPTRGSILARVEALFGTIKVAYANLVAPAA